MEKGARKGDEEITRFSSMSVSKEGKSICIYAAYRRYRSILDHGRTYLLYEYEVKMIDHVTIEVDNRGLISTRV